MTEPKKPHDPKKKPAGPTKPGFGDAMSTAGGIPAPPPPNTSSLKSVTFDELMGLAEQLAEPPPVLTPGLGQVIGVAGGLEPPPPLSAPHETPQLPLAPPDLERRLRKPRTLFSAAMSVVAGIMSVIAMVPLVSVLGMLIWRGGQRISVALFTELPPAALGKTASAAQMAAGGIGNALLGTLLMVGIAALIAVPFGIVAAVFLSEFAPRSRTASAVRFTAKVLSGLPSVLAGLFAYAAVVKLTGRYSAPAGGIALAILMLPTVLLTAEQAIKMVPQRMREAAIGMGCTETQVVWHITLPTALPGILTGVMLAVARAAGETAPLLFTALFSDYWLTSNPMEPTASLAVLIFDFSSSPFPNQIQVAWAASLVLVVLVLMANVAAQLWTARSAKK
jgi:phosphate transport system permease protein